MRVTHEVHLLDGVGPADSFLLEGRYRVYWTHLPGSSLKSFGVVDISRQGSGLPLKDFALLDAAQSDGRAHCVRVATAANALDATATALGFHLEGLVTT